jgi:hypothetical protein
MFHDCKICLDPDVIIAETKNLGYQKAAKLQQCHLIRFFAMP